jgi:uncharacterized protein YdhG (YjbR/CyaY superfamily)
MTTGKPNSPSTSARSAEVDDFLAALPDDVRLALEGLRGMIAAAAPEAVETMAYSVPAFKYRGRPLVSFGAGRSARDRCSLYVQSLAVMAAHRDELASYDTTKGTIHFAPDAPLPEGLVTRLVEARMAETDARGR